MKAVRVHRTGGPEVLTLEEVPRPEPKAGELQVQLVSIGLNFIDIYQRSGLYKLPLPFTLGVEGAGVVTATGPEVKDIVVGNRVAFAMTQGTYAQYVCVPESKAVVLPEGIHEETGAAMMVQGVTAHYLTRSTFPLAANQTALVHAAAGGVGLLLIQICKILGARVIGTVSNEEKAELAREAGADEVINYSTTDFEPEVRRLTDGAGVDVVYDSVGKATFDRSLNCLKTRGYLVLFGQSSGPVSPLDAQILSSKGSLFLTRPSLAHYMRTREELQQRVDELLGWVSRGRLKFRIGARFPLDSAAYAHQTLEARKTTGKVILLPVSGT